MGFGLSDLKISGLNLKVILIGINEKTMMEGHHGLKTDKCCLIVNLN